MTGVTESLPRLADLAEPERGKRFVRLQERMLPVWDAMRRDAPGESIVVVPSVTPDPTRTGAILQAYEERFLFLLLLLRQPRLQVVYVTGRPVEPAIVDYYLGLLPGVIASHARRRLHMVAAHDGRWGRRRAAGGCSPRPGSRIRWGARTCGRSRTSSRRSRRCGPGVPTWRVRW
jgi:hypothetical protein